MKELSKEEKAKAYDEVLEKLKKYEGSPTLWSYDDMCEKFFPELKESEDERISNEIIQFLQLPHPQFVGKRHQEEWITWLEKQGEQKPTDKVEPKFKVGDKIQYLKGCGTIMTIEKIENGEYIFGNNMGHTTIESGNKWHLVEQKSAWSEEDDKILKSIIINIENLQFSEDMREKYHHILNANKSYYQIKIDWLESLKDRVQPQPKNEWSEEDEKKLLCVCAWIKDYPRIADFKDEMYTVANNYINWLKSLRPQKQWKPSEEQMKALDEARSLANNCGEESAFDLRTLYEQLKKLREE